MENKMKDLHSHILYGIDDGSKSLEESISILKLAASEGITDIMLTPHYIKNTRYQTNNQEKIKRYQTLIEKIKEENIDIKVYLGNEIYISESIINDLQNGECLSLNNTKYVLVELPLNNYLRKSQDVFFELIRHGYIPVLAHPERYSYFKKNPHLLEEFLNLGVLLQGNYTSLFGKYGQESKRFLKQLLKENKITFLGSDIHHKEKFSINKLYKKLKRIIKDEQKIKNITINNFDLLITNKDI